MAYIEFNRINKLYEGGVHAIEDVSFEIEEGQFTVLVGPSGCGKSTFLRMLAGLEEVTTGTIKMNGEIINEVHPKDRNISMVFQNYALYPHLSVYENIAFGLKLKRIKTPVKNKEGKIIFYKNEKISKDEIDQRVKEVSAKLELTDYLSRKPKQLSGGQKQRVALARALVRNNDVFLLDEPLSNLDAKLRVEMRKVIKTLHQNVRKPFIYVTHDQVEAMTMADKIVVLKLGVVQQIGSPKEIYDEPSNLFVATFFGSPAMSIIDGVLFEEKDKIGVELLNGDKLYIPETLKEEFLNYDLIGQKVKIGFRPTSYRVSKPEHIDHYSKVHGEVFYKELFGSETLLKVKLFDSENIDVFVPNDYQINIGDHIELFAHTTKMKIFDAKTEKSIFGTTKEISFRANYKLNKDTIDFELGGTMHQYPVGTRALTSLESEGQINVSFDTEHISLSELPNSVKLSGKVVSIRNLFARKAIFMEVQGKKEPLICYIKKDDPIKVGDWVSTYIHYDFVSFKDENHNSILSKYDIKNVVTDNNLNIVKQVFKISDDVTEFSVPFNGVNAVLSRKDAIKDKDHYYTVKAICLDSEDYKGNTLLYYKLKGMNGYLTAILNKKIDMVKKPVLEIQIPKQ